MDVYFSLGSNLGDREGNLRKALSLMEERLGTKVKRLSSFYVNPSQGFDGEEFINCAALFDIEDDCASVLRICKSIEAEMGRRENIEFDSEGNRIYHDRIIDIDILLYGDRTINQSNLIVPHPRMEEREFVMKPLSEIKSKVF